MSSKAQNLQAVDAINTAFGAGTAQLIDHRDYGDGLIIDVEGSGLESYDVTASGTVHGALPRNTFLEPINNCTLRLVRA